MERYTIVITHSFVSDMLCYTILQAVHTNPSARIILLGNDDNQRLPLVEHHNISRYRTYSGSFEELYIHQSEHTEFFEKICISRWLIVLDFLEQNQIEECFCMDSDVLLYCNVEEQKRYFQDFEMTLNRCRSAGTTYFNNRQILKDFCCFVLELYQDWTDYPTNSFLGEFSHINPDSNVCDMSLWGWFYEKHPDRIGDLIEVHDGSVFDGNIHAAEGFVMDGERKKVIWNEDKPYGVRETSGEKVKFNCLHLQGPAKEHVAKYYSLANIRSSLLCEPLLPVL